MFYVCAQSHITISGKQAIFFFIESNKSLATSYPVSQVCPDGHDRQQHYSVCFGSLKSAAKF